MNSRYRFKPVYSLSRRAPSADSDTSPHATGAAAPRMQKRNLAQYGIPVKRMNIFVPYSSNSTAALPLYGPHIQTYFHTRQSSTNTAQYAAARSSRTPNCHGRLPLSATVTSGRNDTRPSRTWRISLPGSRTLTPAAAWRNLRVYITARSNGAHYGPRNKIHSPLPRSARSRFPQSFFQRHCGGVCKQARSGLYPGAHYGRQRHRPLRRQGSYALSS